MKLRTFSSEGIVLARRNYGEADRILVVFSKAFGKLHLLAKGVRRPKSRKRGHLEVFSRVKFSVATGRGISIMTEAESINSYSQIRSNLKKVSVAYYLMEVIGRVTREDEKHDVLYDLVLDTLESLVNSNNLKSLREQFARDVLISLGFWPRNVKLENPDQFMESIIERKLASIRVGKKVLL